MSNNNQEINALSPIKKDEKQGWIKSVDIGKQAETQ